MVEEDEEVILAEVVPDEPEEEAPEEEEEFRPRKKKKKKFRSKGSSNSGDIAAVCVGLALLVFLGFSVFLPYRYMSFSGSAAGASRSQSASADGMGNVNDGTERSASRTDSREARRGKTILIVSLAVAVITGVFFVIAAARGFVSDWSEDAFAGASSLAAGWGVAAALWMTGYIWQTITAWIKANSEMRRMRDELISRVSAVGGQAPSIDMSVTVLPHIGLLLAFLAAAGIAVLFCLQTGNRGRGAWLGIGCGAGALVGILVVAIWIEPWGATFGRSY